MASKVYPKWKEAVIQASSDSSLGGTVKAALVDTGVYTYSDAHEFYSSVSSAVIGTPQTLNNKTYTNGTFDGDDVTYTAVLGNTVEAIVIYIDTGNAATSRLVAYIDGTVDVEIAADASISAVAIVTEDLPNTVADNATLTKVSGSGPTTITVNGQHTAGDRTIDVDALTGALNAGAVYNYPIFGFGLPVTPNGGNITITWDTDGIFTPGM
jgi:hypothetical protein